MIRANRRDANEQRIVGVFRAASGYWQPCDISQGHDGNLYLRGQTFAVEIKDGTKSPSKRRLTSAECLFMEEIKRRGVRLWLIESEDDALALIARAIDLEESVLHKVAQ